MIQKLFKLVFLNLSPKNNTKKKKKGKESLSFLIPIYCCNRNGFVSPQKNYLKIQFPKITL
jgi:hypothetical protein